MPRYNEPRTRQQNLASPVKTDRIPAGTTHQGGPGYARSAASELYLLAVSSMGMDLRFYDRDPKQMAYQVTPHERVEAARAAPRLTGIPFQETPSEIRLVELAREVAVADYDFMAGFVPWLRSGAFMRSASVVAAAETLKGRLDAGLAPAGRSLANLAMQRADEPGEMAAYWSGKYGRIGPMPLKRALADAALRLYTQYSLLKYDTASHGWRFGDVIEVSHPLVRAPADLFDNWEEDRRADMGPEDVTRYIALWEARKHALFRYAMERRHGRDNEVPVFLGMIRANIALRREAAQDASMIPLDPDRLHDAGMTWEDLLSLAGNKIDKAALWSAIVPSMGIMALLRNLNNFDKAGLPDLVAEQVAAKLADPEVIASSKLFPFRFLSAYNAVHDSLRWNYSLEKALNLSLSNVPPLDGWTLILVDRSGSMQMTTSPTARLTLADQAALFGSALARRAARATLVQYGSSSGEVRLRQGGSVLADIRQFRDMGGTFTAEAIRRHLQPGHTRVVLITDEQHASGDPSNAVPAATPMYTWNLAGYRHGHAPSGWHNRHTFGGLSDTSFRMISLLEAGRDAAWPWEISEDAVQ